MAKTPNKHDKEEDDVPYNDEEDEEDEDYDDDDDSVNQKESTELHICNNYNVEN